MLRFWYLYWRNTHFWLLLALGNRASVYVGLPTCTVYVHVYMYKYLPCLHMFHKFPPQKAPFFGEGTVQRQFRALSICRFQIEHEIQSFSVLSHWLKKYITLTLSLMYIYVGLIINSSLLAFYRQKWMTSVLVKQMIIKGPMKHI